MNSTGFFFSLAFNNLRRSGQRGLVALACIAFGVMALVAMSGLAQSIERTLVLKPRELVGADIVMGRSGNNFILPGQVSELQALQQSGQILGYTTMAYTSSLMFHLPGSGEMHFVNAGMGIDPAKYPLAGALTVGQPGGIAPAALLQAVGDMLITRDIAQDYGLKVGDTLILASLDSGAPVEGRIRGIAYDTPNHMGGKIYYSLPTAEKLGGRQPTLNTALVIAANPAAAAETLASAGWEISLVVNDAAPQSPAQDLVILSLKGAGMIGLLVGGVGVGNTMQVLLRRRRREVAIWKTLGYTERQLQVLFTLEAALLGVAGSLLGVILGLAISSSLVELVRRTSSSLLFGFSFSPLLLLSGILVGILTTIVFAALAIVSTSQVRPAALLRNEPVDVRRLSLPTSAGLAAGLGLPFFAITSLIMGSLMGGAGVLLAALAALGILGGVFGVLVNAAARLLPTQAFPLFRMAKTSLKRRGVSLALAMIALFAGVIPIAFGAVVVENGVREMDERSIEMQGYNINVIAPAGLEGAVRQAVAAQNPVQVAYEYTTAVSRIQNLGSASSAPTPLLLIGPVDPQDYQISGAAWGSDPQGVYVNQSDGIPVGSQVEVTLRGGSSLRLDVAGTYVPNWQPGSLYPKEGLLLPAALSARLAPPDTVTFFVEAPKGKVAATAASLGKALPGASVVNLVAYASRFTQTYQNLFILALAMAGLAFLAGAVLVANSVSLAMLDRQHELGVLKALGYSQAHILFTLEVEYGLAALIACAAGLVVVQAFLWLISLANHLAGSLLVLTPLSALLIGLFGVGLVLLTVMGVTWSALRASPTQVLNERQ